MSEEILTTEESAAVQNNMRYLSAGEKLTDDGGNSISFVEIILEDEDKEASEFTLAEFAELTLYIEPKSKRELELEQTIRELTDKLDNVVSLKGEPRQKKKASIFGIERQKDLVAFYSANKSMKLKEIAAEFNISSKYAGDLLDKHGVRIRGKKNRKITEY